MLVDTTGTTPTTGAITVAITVPATTLLFLLLEYVEHLLAVHTLEPRIAHAHLLALVWAIPVHRHSYHRPAGVQLLEHQVDHVVTGNVG
ncbi:MAG: hypothetical protein JW384_02199 [Nitrosomonadaceae bacterium]|nr:hypothetical protein [Nitrosomonadaceae bacterium]